MIKKRIILTGGGTAGHVTPNLALAEALQNAGYELHYIGLKDSIEEKLVSEVPGIDFHSIRSGKLRRYFSWQNFSDPFKVIAGIGDAKKIMRVLKPALVFSKGGFVTVPVVMAAKSKKIPVLLHESDYSPGLANKIASRYAQKILVTFEDTLQYTGNKGSFTGAPIRPALLQGDAEKGRAFLAFDEQKPLLLSMGGSLGAQAINKTLREILPDLTEDFNVVHLCGKGNLDVSLNGHPNYRQYEYISEELPDLMAAADIALSRAGANSVFELLALSLPALLVPLTKSSSRGDQLLNAAYFKRMGYADVLYQEDMTAETLLESLRKLYKNRGSMVATMEKASNKTGNEAVLQNIIEIAGSINAE